MNTTTDELQTILMTALQTAAAIAATDPKAAAAVALAPLITELIKSATQMAQAGSLTPEALAQMLKDIGGGILITQARWDAMSATGAEVAKE